jgi:hypothetical protein
MSEAEAIIETPTNVLSEPPGVTETEKPFYEREDWTPMSEDQITRVIEYFSQRQDGGMVYLPEYLCKKKGIDFEEANRSLTLKEVLEPQRKLTTRERLQAKLEERKKSQAK